MNKMNKMNKIKNFIDFSLQNNMFNALRIPTE